MGGVIDGPVAHVIHEAIALRFVELAVLVAKITCWIPHAGVISNAFVTVIVAEGTLAGTGPIVDLAHGF